LCDVIFAKHHVVYRQNEELAAASADVDPKPPSVCLLAIFFVIFGVVIVLGRVLTALTRGILSLVFDECFFAQLFETEYTILYV